MRRVRSRLGRVGRRARRSVGGKFGSWKEIGKGAIGLLATAKIKDFLNIHFGGNNSPIDRDVEMIVTGLWAPHAKLGNGHFVPAGTSALIADLADGFIFGGGTMPSFPGFGGMGGTSYAGSPQSQYAGG